MTTKKGFKNIFCFKIFTRKYGKLKKIYLDITLNCYNSKGYCFALHIFNFFYKYRYFVTNVHNFIHKQTMLIYAL